MKYARMLGMLAVAVAVMMAFAATAFATTLTSPTGTTYTGELHAVSGEITLHGIKTITCDESTASGDVEAHGSTSTVESNLTTLTFTSCHGDDVTVELKGRLIVHTDPEEGAGKYDGTVTSDGATILIHITSLGLTCGFRTELTHIGRLTSSASTGETAVLDINSAKLPRHFGGPFCGSNGIWTGSYRITTPDQLFVD